MVAVTLWITQALFLVLIIAFLWREGRRRTFLLHRGWLGIVIGLALIAGGMVLDAVLTTTTHLAELVAQGHGLATLTIGAGLSALGTAILAVGVILWLPKTTSLNEVEQFSRVISSSFARIQHSFLKSWKSENLHRSLSQSVTDAIVSFDANNTILFWNKGASVIFGYNEEEIIGLSLLQLIPPDHHVICQRRLNIMRKRVGAGFSGFVEEFDGLRKDGSHVSIEISLGSWILDDGQHYCAVIRDITQRKETEKNAERVQQSRVAISAILRIALEPISLQEQLSKSLDVLLSVPWLDILHKGAIFLYDEPSGDLVLTVQRGLHAHLLNACARIAPGQCYCGRALQNKALFYAPSIDHRHDVTFEGIKPHGHYCLPILSQGRVLGVINTYIADGHVRNEEEIEFLSAIANTLAGLIERKRVEDQIRHFAFHDTLTGLPNRKLLNDQVEQCLAAAKRHKKLVAILFIDLDGFKAVNDTLGHDAGDHLLIEAARRIKLCLRGEDFVARIGGDEFVAVLTEIARKEDAGWVADRLIDQLATPFPFRSSLSHIGASIGVSIFPEHGQESEILLKYADGAMYDVKKSTKNGYRFYTSPAS